MGVTVRNHGLRLLRCLACNPLLPQVIDLYFNERAHLLKCQQMVLRLEGGAPGWLVFNLPHFHIHHLVAVQGAILTLGSGSESLCQLASKLCLRPLACCLLVCRGGALHGHAMLWVTGTDVSWQLTVPVPRMQRTQPVSVDRLLVDAAVVLFCCLPACRLSPVQPRPERAAAAAGVPGRGEAAGSGAIRQPGSMGRAQQQPGCHRTSSGQQRHVLPALEQQRGSNELASCGEWHDV